MKHLNFYDVATFPCNVIKIFLVIKDSCAIKTVPINNVASFVQFLRLSMEPFQKYGKRQVLF